MDNVKRNNECTEAPIMVYMNCGEAAVTGNIFITSMTGRVAYIIRKHLGRNTAKSETLWPFMFSLQIYHKDE